MDYLRRGSFGALFGVTFTIAATFQILMALIGLVVAVTAPGFFKMNGAPAATPLQAIGVDLFLLIVLLLLNTMISATGSGVWLLIRRFLPKSPKSLTEAA